MGTRCHIGVRKGNKVDYIYCGHDGYVDGIGELLVDKFNTAAKANELIGLGSISWVYDCDEERAMTFFGMYLKDEWSLVEVCGCFACAENGVKPSSMPASKYVEFGKNQTMDDAIMIEYWYLFDGGEWLVSKGGDIAKFIPVTEALKKPELVESRLRRGRMLKESEDGNYTFTYETPNGEQGTFTVHKKDLLDGSRWSEVEYRDAEDPSYDETSYDETITSFDVPTPPIHSWNKIELICVWRNERGESDIYVNGPRITFDEIVSIVDPDGNEVYNRDTNRSGEFYRAIGQLKRLNDAAPEDRRAITVESLKEARRLDEEFSTTFWMDFSIADRFGISAVKDTFRRAFDEWKDDYRYLTDLVIVLNHKIWQHYEKNEPLARVYNDLWEKARDYAEKNLKGEELDYYFEQTD